MTLDKEEHRGILLELITKAHFPGGVARKVVELTDAVENATIADPPDSEPKDKVAA